MSSVKPTEMKRENRILGLSNYFIKNPKLKRKEIFTKFMRETNPGVREETLHKDMWDAVTLRSYLHLPGFPLARLTEYQKKGPSALIERLSKGESEILGKEKTLEEGVEAFLSHEPVKEEFMGRIQLALPEGPPGELMNDALKMLQTKLNEFQNNLGAIGVLMDEIGEGSRKEGYWIFHPRATEAYKWLLAGQLIYSLPRIIEILKSERLEPREKEAFAKKTAALLLREHLQRSEAHKQYLEAEASWIRALKERIKEAEPLKDEEIAEKLDEIRKQLIPPELEAFEPQEEEEAERERERAKELTDLIRELSEKIKDLKASPEKTFELLNKKREAIFGSPIPPDSEIPRLLEEIHSKTSSTQASYRQNLIDVLNALERKRAHMLPLYRTIKRDKDILELPGDLFLASIRRAIVQAARGKTPRILIPPAIEKLFKEFAPLAAKNISLANESWSRAKETEEEKERILRNYEEKIYRPTGA